VSLTLKGSPDLLAFVVGHGVFLSVKTLRHEYRFSDS
jgi:hypothetical protein